MVGVPLGGTLTATLILNVGGLSLLTEALVVVWIASEVGVRLYARALGAPSRVPHGPDRGSWAVLSLSVIVSIVVSLWDHTAPLGGPLPLWALAVGQLAMLLGISVRSWALLVLGRFFTTRVSFQEGHRLVTGGPYRWVRHPSYTGALLSLLGFPLACGSLLGLVVALVVVPGAFVYRIHVEEQALREGFGPAYEQYSSRTYRLVPGLY